MIITITGLPGAGKSTIGKMLAAKLNLPRYSAGDFRRKMAEARGITLQELNTLGETQEFTDKEVDAYQEKLGKEQDNFIIDGRLSWHFIPHSKKVFLDVEPGEAAKRIFQSSKGGDRPNEQQYETVEEVRGANAERLASDVKRYNKYYGIDYLEKSNYDMVIDTTNKTPEEIIGIILEGIDAKS